MIDGEAIVWFMVLTEWPVLLLLLGLILAFAYGLGKMFKWAHEMRK